VSEEEEEEEEEEKPPKQPPRDVYIITRKQEPHGLPPRSSCNPFSP
jgi:hypothetical protein